MKSIKARWYTHEWTIVAIILQWMKRLWTEMGNETDHRIMKLRYGSEVERSSNAKSNRIFNLKWQMAEMQNC